MVSDIKFISSEADSKPAQRIFVPLNDALKNSKVFRSACVLVQTLKSAGFEALFVGGFVRKLVLDKKLADVAAVDSDEPGRSHTNRDDEIDIDIATSADPQAIKRLFRNSHFVGQTFGVSMVDHGHHAFEVASFRTEGPYSDGRRPDHVALGTLYQDSCRRDFTINALYFDPDTSEVIDFHGGADDANHLLLRTVGNPIDRFSEDKLRIFRMCRFAANNRLQIEPLTWQAAQDLAHSAVSVSRERVILEFKKTETTALRHFLAYCSLLDLDALFWKVKCDLDAEFFRKFCERQNRFDFPVSLLLLSGWSVFLRLSTSEKWGVLQHLVAWPTTIQDRKLLQNLLFFGETFRFSNEDTVLESDERCFVHAAMFLNLLRKVSLFTFTEIRLLTEAMKGTQWELSPLNTLLFEELLMQLLQYTGKNEDALLSESFAVFDHHEISKGNQKRHLWRSAVIANLQKHQLNSRHFAAYLVFADLVGLLPKNSFGMAFEKMFFSLAAKQHGEFELDTKIRQALEQLVNLEKKVKLPRF